MRVAGAEARRRQGEYAGSGARVEHVASGRVLLLGESQQRRDRVGDHVKTLIVVEGVRGRAIDHRRQRRRRHGPLAR